LGTYYVNLGKNYYFKKDYAKAKDSYEIARKLTTNSFGNKHPKLAACYRFYGQLFMAQHQFRKSLEYFQQAIIANVQGFDNPDIFDNPELENILSKTYLVYILEDKAKAFYKLFCEHPDSIIFLQAALKTSDLAISLLDVIRTEYKIEGSKFFLNQIFCDRLGPF